MTKAITDPDPAAAGRAFDAMMQMGKIDIAAIEAAFLRQIQESRRRGQGHEQMKRAHGVIIATGVAILVVMLLVSFLSVGSGAFRKDHGQFAVQFTRDFSRGWDPSSVEERLTDEMVSAMSSPDGHRALATFRRLGALVEAGNLEFSSYQDSADRESGVFRFEARFEAGAGLVVATVSKTGEAVRIAGFVLNVTALR